MFDQEIQYNKDIIFVIKQQTDKHHVSSSTGFSDQQILEYALTARARLLYERLNKYGRLDASNYMTTPCMNLVEASSCPCPVPESCTPFVTELFLPVFIGEIVSVRNYDMTYEYEEGDLNINSFRKDWRIKDYAYKSVWFKNNEGSGTKLYMMSEKPLKNIKVTLIPYKPETIFRMPECDGTLRNTCFSSYDVPWILNPELTKIVINMTTEFILGKKAQSTDIRNNIIDDNVQNRQEINT